MTPPNNSEWGIETREAHFAAIEVNGAEASWKPLRFESGVCEATDNPGEDDEREQQQQQEGGWGLFEELKEEVWVQPDFSFFNNSGEREGKDPLTGDLDSLILTGAVEACLVLLLLRRTGWWNGKERPLESSF